MNSSLVLFFRLEFFHAWKMKKMFSFLSTREKGVCSRKLLVYAVIFKFLLNKSGKVSQSCSAMCLTKMEVAYKTFFLIFFQREMHWESTRGSSTEQRLQSPPCSGCCSKPMPGAGTTCGWRKGRDH